MAFMNVKLHRVCIQENPFATEARRYAELQNCTANVLHEMPGKGEKKPNQVYMLLC